MEQTREEIRRTPVGTYRGLTMTFATRKGCDPSMEVAGQRTEYLPTEAIAAGSLFNRIDARIVDMPRQAAASRRSREVKIGQLTAFESRVGLPFEHEAHMDALSLLRHRIEGALSGEQTDNTRERTDALLDEYARVKTAASAASKPSPPEPLPPPLAEPVLRLVVDHVPASLPSPPEPLAPASAAHAVAGANQGAPMNQERQSEGRWVKAVAAQRARPVQLDLFLR